MRPLVVGTRGSALALWQTKFVIAALKRLEAGLEIENRILTTAGDREPNRPLEEFGARGVFTDALENALHRGEIDLAVHSLKDLPTAPNAAFTLAAILERADARDVLVSRHALTLAALPPHSRVGTGSLRRGAQVLALRPDLEIAPLRGNVDTRLKKASTGDYDAIVIAAAGVLRLGRGDEITEYLELYSFLPDPGQGALAVQTRSDDTELVASCGRLDHTPTRAATTAERAFVAAWSDAGDNGMADAAGGCSLPIGAYAEVDGEALHLRGLVGTRDGKTILRGGRAGMVADAEGIGRALAEKMKQEWQG